MEFEIAHGKGNHFGIGKMGRQDLLLRSAQEHKVALGKPFFKKHGSSDLGFTPPGKGTTCGCCGVEGGVLELLAACVLRDLVVAQPRFFLKISS